MQGIEVRQRFDALEAARKNLEGIWDITERFVAPYRGEMFTEQTSENQIDWRRREVYDTTAIMAHQHLASTLHGGMTNPSFKWFGLKFRQHMLNEDQAAAAWLEECSEAIWLALTESDFNLEINEGYLDLTSFGTSILVEEPEDDEVWKGLDFTAIPVKECYFEPDHKNNVKILYRRLLWSPVQIMSKFKDKTPDDIKQQAAGAAGIDTKEIIIFCIYPREGMEDVDTSKPLPPDRRPYAFKYIRHKDASELGDGGGFYEMPAFVTRWRKTSESMWGHSPSMIALADILSLNQTIELDMRSREKAIDPPVLTTERGVYGDVDLEAGGLTVVRSLDEMKAFDVNPKFEATNDLMNRLREQIREVFFLDKFDLKESPAMTATEVIERTERMHRILGPTVGRLQSDLFNPLISRTFNILFRAGQLPETPPQVQEAGAEFDIEYAGSLARAQKLDRAQSIERFAQGVMNLTQVQPRAADKVNWDKVVDEYAEGLSIPADILNDAAAVKEIRRMAAEQERAQQQLAMAEQAASAMKDAGAAEKSMEGIDGGTVEELGLGEAAEAA